MDPNRFDEGFQGELMKTIMSNRLPDDICQVLKSDNHSRVIKNERLRELIYGFNRALLTYLCDFCQVSLIGNVIPFEKSNLTIRQKLDRLLHHSANRSTSKWWPYVLLLVYVVVCIMTTFKTYHLFIYDAYTAKLLKLQEYLNESSSMLPEERQLYHNNNNNNNHLSHQDGFRSMWTLRAREARETLKIFGASHIDWSFMVEGIVLIFLIPGILQFIISPIVYKLSNMVFLVPRVIIDPRSEAWLRLQMTIAELENFSLDCLSYARTKLEQMSKDLSQPAEISKEDALLNRTGSIQAKTNDCNLRSLRHKALSVFAMKLRQRHQATIKQLKGIALEGRLNWLNGTPACRDKLALFFFCNLLIMVFYMHTNAYSGYLSLMVYFTKRGSPVQLDSFKNILDALCLWLVFEIANFSALLALTLFATTLVDQIILVTKLRQLILLVVRKNEIRLRQLTGDHDQRPSSTECCRFESKKDKLDLSRDFELDLLMLIMQSRLVARTLALARQALDALSVILIYFSFATPILIRTFCAYVDSDLKTIATIVGLGCIAFCLSLLTPLGLLHQRTLRTFGAYWHLVAQLSHFESISNINQCLKIDSSVAVFTLRRELADSRQTTDRFACRVLSIPITYNNLIKVSFGLFLLLMSVASNVNIYGEWIARFMQDPFGLFRFLPN